MIFLCLALHLKENESDDSDHHEKSEIFRTVGLSPYQRSKIRKSACKQSFFIFHFVGTAQCLRTLYHTFLIFCIVFETFYDYAVSNSQMIRKNQIFAKEDLILKFFSGKEKKLTAESNDELIERLLLENYNRYYHLAYSYVHNPDDASDIVQNGAYLAIKNSASLRQPEYAATWIYRIMLNEIFHHLKRPDTISYEDSLIAEGKPDQYQDLDLRTALDSLSPEDKAIVELRYFEDLKIEDIARVLNENVNTIKSRLYRSMQKLKLKMEVTE